MTSSASQEELIKLGHECNKVLTEQVFQVEIENPGEGARKVRIYPAQIFPNHTAFFWPWALSSFIYLSLEDGGSLTQIELVLT